MTCSGTCSGNVSYDWLTLMREFLAGLETREQGLLDELQTLRVSLQQPKPDAPTQVEYSAHWILQAALASNCQHQALNISKDLHLQ